ncbi:MAG TPA: FAD-dependent monooxygenase [Actinoplanes sp.]|nr:FAD-dependent monooxygenase [Actinoplanes sp.]
MTLRRTCGHGRDRGRGRARRAGTGDRTGPGRDTGGRGRKAPGAQRAEQGDEPAAAYRRGPRPARPVVPSRRALDRSDRRGAFQRHPVELRRTRYAVPLPGRHPARARRSRTRGTARRTRRRTTPRLGTDRIRAGRRGNHGARTRDAAGTLPRRLRRRPQHRSKLLGVAFHGTEATQYNTITDVILGAGTEQPPTGWTSMRQARRQRPDGSFASIVPIGEPGLYRFVYFDWRRERTEVTGEEVAGTLRSFYGDEYKLLEVRYASRFSDASRQAEKYRVGRVFLAGDAAHIHLPAGGQGLNLGVQDAFNLGWKLAAVVAGRTPETLLDTYHAERHPVGARVLDNTRAQSVLRTSDLQHTALREILTELLDIPEANRAIAAMITGLDIDYGGTGQTGTRLPDFRIGPRWASELFHSGHGALLATDEKHLAPAKPWADRVTAVLVDDLPWPDIEAVLVRPDGYVCWTATGETVTTPLQAWFGAAH